MTLCQVGDEPVRILGRQQLAVRIISRVPGDMTQGVGNCRDIAFGVIGVSRDVAHIGARAIDGQDLAEATPCQKRHRKSRLRKSCRKDCRSYPCSDRHRGQGHRFARLPIECCVASRAAMNFGQGQPL
jgi:hypothetical protein